MQPLFGGYHRRGRRRQAARHELGEHLKCKETCLLFKGAAVSESSGLVGEGATHLCQAERDSIHPCKAPPDRSEVLDCDTSEVK